MATIRAEKQGLIDQIAVLRDLVTASEAAQQTKEVLCARFEAEVSDDSSRANNQVAARSADIGGLKTELADAKQVRVLYRPISLVLKGYSLLTACKPDFWKIVQTSTWRNNGTMCVSMRANELTFPSK